MSRLKFPVLALALSAGKEVDLRTRILLSSARGTLEKRNEHKIHYVRQVNSNKEK